MIFFQIMKKQIIRTQKKYVSNEKDEVEIMLIPSHMALEDNELVFKRARHAALNSAVFDKPLPPVNCQTDKICSAKRMTEELVDLLSPYSRRFLFDLGLLAKGRTGDLLPLFENNDWSLCRSITLE
jgi:hypothetical protein